MKTFIYILLLSTIIYGCNTGKSSINSDNNTSIVKNDTIRIANDSLEYEIIVIEPGFSSWLISQPPKGYYGVTYLETKNQIWTTEYNTRVRGIGANRNLYEQEINYDPFIHYGLDVNYMLYNYFVYFQEKYNQRFIGGK